MKHKISFREATAADAEFIGRRLRAADAAEVSALGVTPERAVFISFMGSDEVWTGLVDGEPAMMFGCRQPLTSDTAEVWALGTDKCTECPREMLILGRKVVQGLRTRYPRMQNYCDARYVASRRWLKRIGFTVHDPEPFGPHGELFCKIEIGG